MVNNESVKSKVFTDDSSMGAEGIGRVVIQRKDEKSPYISDVLYVPSMKNNLLTLGQLLEKGYTMTMEQSHMRIYNKKKRLIMKVPPFQKQNIQDCSSQQISATFCSNSRE